jgi:hypothetical protein
MSIVGEKKNEESSHKILGSSTSPVDDCTAFRQSAKKSRTYDLSTLAGALSTGLSTIFGEALFAISSQPEKEGA